VGRHRDVGNVVLGAYPFEIEGKRVLIGKSSSLTGDRCVSVVAAELATLVGANGRNK